MEQANSTDMGGGGRSDTSMEEKHVVFKKTLKYQLSKDCQLVLRELSTGLLEYSSLPLYGHDCLVHFPSYQYYQATVQLGGATSTPPPGILVALQRLNVPCSGGGFVRFSERATNVCGKLEELPDDERTFHFDVRRRASVRFYKSPMFSLSYKLVDYCYNVTTSNETGEFYIQSRRRDSLECYFRIHLPYGNRILLRLVTNNDSAILPTSTEAGFTGGFVEDAIFTVQGQSIDTQVINLTLSSLGSSSSSSLGMGAWPQRKRVWEAATYGSTNRTSRQQTYDYNYLTVQNNAQILSTANCRGIIIKVFENDLAKWSHCVNNTQHMRGFVFESTGNTLSVHLYKASYSGAYATNPRTSLHSNGVAADIPPGVSTETALRAIYLSYEAHPVPELTSNCEFGWIAMQQFCITAIESAFSWHAGEQHCAGLGGNLASVRNDMQQQLMNDMLIHSPGYREQNAYWVGGSDVSYEGDFRWSDGLPFQYTNWFPGWVQHGHYNKQPNDDGLSSQDCIELRRYFRAPPGVQTNRNPLTSSFMWNDRDCSSQNLIICERAMSEESLLRSWINDCNKTVSLTKEHPRASIWSPSFPRQYPDNANCFTTITAPMGYRIVIEFEELVIENEPG